MLQTDVMRFFAILCLCLMAIFALVKALPMSPPADRPTIAPPPDLRAEAASLEKQIMAHKEKLAGLQARVADATEAIKNAEALAADAAVREQETLARLSRTRAELRAVSQSLQATRNEIETREEVLAGIVKDIAAKRRVREELQAQIEVEKENNQKMQRRLNRAAVNLSNAIAHQQPSPPKTPPAPSPPPPARKGFTLRFASDTALDTLINHGKVQFFAFAGQKAWKLNMADGRRVYSAVQMPAAIYEMETATVPARYIASFSRQVAAFGQGKVTWGVTLPGQTANTVTRLIQNRDGGDLIIMPSGEVKLN
jgi:hypothetical protein